MTKRHVAAVARASLIEVRTTDDTRDKAAADRHSRACTCACFDRDAKRADLPAAEKRRRRVPLSVVGGGALRAVVLLSGRGCIKYSFCFCLVAPLLGNSTRAVGFVTAAAGNRPSFGAFVGRLGDEF